ncbi:hypothetical protein RvY_06831 [Ramazzottius varieornatus]|uniref:Serpin domain-containing protein n=1 Tax=Ramazzottius varieornatus TaxID=947166 RepID=A0A1D1UZY3_RAMVA|nr:hypothetical protein RvY_06831 [Ramazzottius varieornatus]
MRFPTVVGLVVAALLVALFANAAPSGKDVNEEGTEAAAATFMSLAGMSMAKELPPVEFFIDHPFMFAIRHDGSGTILFLGRVAKL